MADPTSPAGSKPVSVPEPRVRRDTAGLVGQSPAASTVKSDLGDAAELDPRIAATQEMLATGKAEVRRVDADRIAALEQMVAEGTYRFDAGSLADRMLDDASVAAR